MCFDTFANDVAARKETKYLDLISAAQCAGYQATLITVEVGSRGLANPQGFMKLKSVLNIIITTSQLNDLMVKAARQVIITSFKIRC